MRERNAVEEQKKSHKKIWIAAAIYVGVILAVLMIANVEVLNGWLSGVLRIFRPVIIGLVVSYLCNPFFRFFERKVFFRLGSPKLRRAVSLTCAFLTFFAIIALLLLLILPQLIESITLFTSNYTGYLASAFAKCNHLIETVNTVIASVLPNGPFLQPISIPSSDLLGNVFGSGGILENLSLEIGTVINAIGQTFSVIADSVLGLFISIYLLASKEKRAAQLNKLRRALFNERTNEHISRFLSIINRSFGGFFVGKLLDSLIIGVLTYILTSLFGIHYALLISTFVGITNIIPVVGPVIGAVPTAFILLLSQPDKVLIYILIIIFIQQLDGNVIGPKILGDNTGVSPLCVMIAITTMGSLWGLTGMLLGVPLYATVLELLDIYVIDKLQKKGLPSGLGNYYAPDTIVDPAKDRHDRSRKLTTQLKREYLRTKRCIENDVTAPLTKKQTFCYRFYKLCMRLHLASEPTDALQVRYAVEDTVRKAEIESNKAFQEHVKQQFEQNATEEAAPDANA